MIVRVSNEFVQGEGSASLDFDEVQKELGLRLEIRMEVEEVSRGFLIDMGLAIEEDWVRSRGRLGF